MIHWLPASDGAKVTGGSVAAAAAATANETRGCSCSRMAPTWEDPTNSRGKNHTSSIDGGFLK